MMSSCAWRSRLQPRRTGERRERRTTTPSRAARLPLTDSEQRATMETGLTGKVALVCAASRGLGKAAARGLAAEGAEVAMCARHMPTLEAAAAEIQAETGADVLAIGADVSRRSDIARLVDQTVRHFGRLDILVTNSGGPKAGPVRRDHGIRLARCHRPRADEHRAAVHGGRPAHAAGRGRPHHQHHVDLGEAADCRPHALERPEARRHGVLEDAGERTGPRRDPRELRGSGLHADRTRHRTGRGDGARARGSRRKSSRSGRSRTSRSAGWPSRRSSPTSSCSWRRTAAGTSPGRRFPWMGDTSAA